MRMPNAVYKEQDMTKRVTEIILVAVIAAVVALPAFGQKVPPIPRDILQRAANQTKTEDLDNVKFIGFTMQGNVGILQGADSNNKVGTFKIGPRRDEKNKMVPNQDLIDVVKDLKKGDLMRISLNVAADGHWVTAVSKLDAPVVDDAKAIIFDTVTEAVVGGQPKVTVLIKTAGKSETLTVPNVKDSLGKWVADPAIMAIIKEFKHDDKIEYTRQTLSNQVVIKTIKLAGAPDKAEFIKMTDKTLGGEKFTAIEVKEGTDKPITLLVANTKDDKGKLTKDDKGNPVPDATLLEAVTALTPGQMVEFKSKAENPAKIMLTEIKAIAAPTTQPAGDKAAGDVSK
jgi:hypothetical protein